MKILIVIGKFPQISETFIIRKAIGLAERGNEVLIMARRKGDLRILRPFGSIPKSLKVEWLIPEYGFSNLRDLIWVIYRVLYYCVNYPVRAFNLFILIHKAQQTIGSIRTWIKFLPFINKQAFNIVHFEFLNLGVSYQQIINIIPGRVFVSCRGSDVHLLPLKTEDVLISTKRALETFDGIHCVSGKIQFFLRKKIGVALKKSFVNWPAIDPHIIQPAANKPQNSPPIILSTGRMEWIKGLDYLLTAYSILHKKGIDFKAVIIGGGALEAELRFSISDLNLEEYIELTGPLHQEEVFAKLKTADIFVLSSHEEGISNSVLEAMAAGLAVVSTQAGGMGEVIESGKDGILVPIRNPEALADALELCLSNAQLREKMGKEARRKIERDFSLTRQIDTFESFYQNAL